MYRNHFIAMLLFIMLGGQPMNSHAAEEAPQADAALKYGQNKEQVSGDDTGVIAAGIGFALEYNDNIRDRADNQETDLIAHLKPVLGLKGSTGRLSASASYMGDYKFYLKDKADQDYMHYLNITAAAEVMENLFFIDLEEDLQPVYRDLTRGDVIQGDTGQDMVNRNRFSVSPYFKLSPGENNKISTGYSYTDTRYSKYTAESRKRFIPAGDDYDLNHNKSTQHGAFLNWTHEFSDTFHAYAGTQITRWEGEKTSRGIDTDLWRYQLYLGAFMQVTEEFSASVKAGPAYSDPDYGGSKLRPYMEADIIYSTGKSVLGAGYFTSYEDNASSGESTRRQEYKVWLERDFDRARLALTLGYNIYESEVEHFDGERGDAFRPALSFSYDLSERLNLFTRYNANLYRHSDDGDDRHYATYGAKYQLAELSWVSLSHMYKYVSGNTGDDYSASSVTLELFVGF